MQKTAQIWVDPVVRDIILLIRMCPFQSGCWGSLKCAFLPCVAVIRSGSSRILSLKGKKKKNGKMVVYENLYLSLRDNI